jgi:hypothetical protein
MQLAGDGDLHHRSPYLHHLGRYLHHLSGYLHHPVMRNT